MHNKQTQPHTEDDVIFDCTTEVQTSQSIVDDDDLSHLEFEMDFKELTGNSDFGRILVVHRSSKMTTDDIKRLTGSATVQEITPGNQIISDNSMVLDLIRTAVEMVNRSVLCLHFGFLSFHSNGLARTPTMMPSR